ncbi:Aspartic protease, partial [Phytophthora megakarya]
MDLPVTSPDNLYLMPGEHAVVRQILAEDVTAKSEIPTLYNTVARSLAVAIKVVNVSKYNVWIDMRTPLARIVQYGSFQQARRFVRPGTRAYREWQTLILEHAQSEQDRLRAERREQALRDREPPCVPKLEYQWPAKIMLRPQPGSAEVRMTRLQDPPCFKVWNRGELVDASTQTEENSPVTTRMDVVTQVSESQLDSPGCDPGDGDTLEDDRSDTFVDTPPEWTTEFEGPQGGETIVEVHPERDTSGFSPEPASCTPLKKLEMEYERCMRVSAEELDLEPGVYIHEGSEMLAQLRDQL